MTDLTVSIRNLWGKVLPGLVRGTERFYYSRILVVLIMVMGIYLRAREYAANVSLWYDEATFALKIQHTPLIHLLMPKHWGGYEPPAFLWLTKLTIYFGGTSEYVLRLWPFLFSLSALFLFWRIVRRCSSRAAMPVALLLFSISNEIIHYADDAKPYACDVALSLLVCLMGFRMSSKPLSLRRGWVYALFGAVVIWFSHVTAIVLGGVGMSLWIFSVIDKRREEFRPLFWISLIWFLSFVYDYFFFLGIEKTQMAVALWKTSFIPVATESVNDTVWWVNRVMGVFAYPGGMPLYGLSVFAFLTGCLLFPKGRRRQWMMIMSPFWLAFLAGLFRLYPFNGRLILFLVPVMCFFVAEGMTWVTGLVAQRSKIVSVLLLTIFFLHPVLNMYERWHEAETRGEEIKPVLKVIRDAWQPGDVLYVFYGAIPAFKYYQKRYGIRSEDCVWGAKSRENFTVYLQEMARFYGRKRVWLLFSHALVIYGQDERRLILDFLSTVGKPVAMYSKTKADCYLFDLSQVKPLGV
ncbi:MAG: glycosyltransferase family 39 protein [Candidatus Omnitrophica bacterium]|nr:glycosyltransferase family 39 protein [Candidatus Omnitrophota bacterium]MDD5671192.1 glycosyltransferase family 39 protein [Candidatus Omnitrophota bacterium]